MRKRTADQAARWFVKLGSLDVSEADFRDFANWMRTQRHRDAYDEVARLWVDLEDLEGWSRTELEKIDARRPRRSRYRGYGIAIGTVAATILLAVFVRMIVVDWGVERFATKRAEQRQIVLDDGSRVHLNTQSAVQVRLGRRFREVTLTEGEGLFDVARDADRPFVVRAGRNRAVALGTTFAVRLAQGEMAVTVLEGRVVVLPARLVDEPVLDLVRVGADAPGSVVLGPEQKARVAAEGELRSLSQVSLTRETAWLEGKLIFEGTPLREVIREISRYATVEIRVADDVPDYPVTGVIKIQNPEMMLDLLSQVVPVVPLRVSTDTTIIETDSSISPHEMD